MRVTAPLILRNGDREKLAKMASSRAWEAGLARRARIVLLAADGLPHTDVAQRCGTSGPTVRRGRAGLVCVDEKSQIQALDRTQPILPLRPGLPERATHDYIRHGITTLFAALEVATGQVVDACYPRHRHQEFLKVLKKVAAAWPGQQLHVVCDNYATHNHPEVKAWLAANPRVTLHFTPTGCSWLNMVEIFFSIITRQAIRRGTYRSVKDLTARIGEFIDGWNERCQPFVWTKSADELLAKVRKKETSRAEH